MSDFEDRLNSILNDPSQMEKITAMAKSLMGAQDAPQRDSEPLPKKMTGLPESLDPTLLSRLAGSLGGGRRDDKRALLEAMKPYLSPQRRERLDRAIQLARMIGMAELAFGVMGGGDAKI